MSETDIACPIAQPSSKSIEEQAYSNFKSFDIKIDTEFRKALPPLTPDEYDLLEHHIIRDGCREALITWMGMLIDGHNRYEICTRNQIPFETKEMDFESRDDALIWVFQNQIGRRNLTDFARTEAALKLKDAIAAKARERQLAGVPQNSAEGNGETREKVGKLAGVSRDTVSKVEYLKEHAPEKVKDELRSGKTSINAAFNEVKTEKKIEEEVEKRVARVLENAALFTSDSEEWYTPSHVIDSVLETFDGAIDTDPCSPYLDGPVPAKWHYTVDEDGLAQSWRGRVFMNPPYGDALPKWIDKCLDEYLNGECTEAIILVPGRLETRWFKRVNDYPFCAIEGRLKFSESKNSATFPSVVFYLGENVKGFYESFSQYGAIFRKMTLDEADIS